MSLIFKGIEFHRKSVWSTRFFRMVTFCVFLSDMLDLYNKECLVTEWISVCLLLDSGVCRTGFLCNFVSYVIHLHGCSTSAESMCCWNGAGRCYLFVSGCDR